MFEFIGKAIGSVVGPILAVPVAAIAIALELPKAIVQEAIDAGCKTYEEIREYCKDEG